MANDLANQERVGELRQRMMSMLFEEQDPRALGNAAIFDTYKYVGSRKKGYETWLAEKLKTAPDMTPPKAEPTGPRKRQKPAAAESN